MGTQPLSPESGGRASYVVSLMSSVKLFLWRCFFYHFATIICWMKIINFSRKSSIVDFLLVFCSSSYDQQAHCRSISRFSVCLWWEDVDAHRIVSTSYHERYNKSAWQTQKKMTSVLCYRIKLRQRFFCTILSTCTCARSIRLSLKVTRICSETVVTFATRLLDSGLLVGFQHRLIYFQTKWQRNSDHFLFIFSSVFMPFRLLRCVAENTKTTCIYK